MKTGSGRFLLLLLVITLTGTAFRLYRILDQSPLTDEVEMAFTAQNYIERGHFIPTMPHHPNLRNILIYLSMKIAGPGALGLRGFSLLFGTLSIPLLGLLMFRLTSDTTASSLSAFFLAIDPVHIVYSRHAIQEVHTAFFFIMGTMLFIFFITGSERNRRFLLPPLAGVCFGLGVSSKAHAVFPLLVCLALVLVNAKKLRDERLLLSSILSLTILPLTIYLICDAPWFGRGYDMRDWLFMKKALSQAMTTKFNPPQTEVNTDGRAWQWFVIPFLGYHEFAYHEGKTLFIVSMGNPLVWCLILPALAYLLYRHGRDKQVLILQAFFWVSYLPLVFAPRKMFLLSSIATTPFAYCLLGLMGSKFAQKKGYKPLFAYVVVVFAVTLLLYPMCVGKAWDFDYLRPLVSRFNPH